MIKILLVFFLLLAFFHSVFNQTLDTAKLDQLFDRLSEKNKAMGTITVSRDGKVLYTRSIGHSHISDGVNKPASARTRYRVGSVSKLFTATMIFQLIEEKKLKLSDTLDKFFPEVPNASKITIEHLLAHRSGVRDLTREPDFRNWKVEPKTRDEMVAIIAKGTPDFEPGEKHAYSNSGYVLLGFIVEKVGGKSLHDTLKERIAAKIGLKDTYLGTGKIDLSKNESLSYRYLRGWEQFPETHLSIPGGGGGVISTTADMAKFVDALFSLKLVSKSSLDQMRPAKEEYGLGLHTIPLGDKTLLGHTGRIDDFHAIAAYLPEEKLAIAFTSNGVVYPASKIVAGVFDITSNKPFQLPGFETFAVKAELLDTYTGVYSTSAAPMKFTIARDRTVLQIERPGAPPIPLEATAENKFQHEAAGVFLEFDAAKNQMTFKQGTREVIFTKEQ